MQSLAQCDVSTHLYDVLVPNKAHNRCQKCHRERLCIWNGQKRTGTCESTSISKSEFSRNQWFFMISFVSALWRTGWNAQKGSKFSVWNGSITHAPILVLVIPSPLNGRTRESVSYKIEHEKLEVHTQTLTIGIRVFFAKITLAHFRLDNDLLWLVKQCTSFNECLIIRCLLLLVI